MELDLPHLGGGSLASLLEASPDATVICTEDGRIVHANPQAALLTGYKAEELTSMHVESLVPARQRSSHENHRSDFLQGPLARRPMGADLDIQLLRQDGVTLPVDIALSRVELGGARLVLAAIRDASERRLAERALQRQAMLLEVANDPIFVRSARDWSISYWNQAAVGVYGYSRTEAVGRPSYELLGTEFPLSREAVDMALAAEGRWDGELVHRRRDGTLVEVSSRHVLLPVEPGEEPSVLEINRDIGIEKRANQQLAVIVERERLSRELTDHLIHSIFGVGLGLQGTAALVLDGTIRERLDDSIAQMDDLVRELRAFIFNLDDAPVTAETG